MSRQRLGPPSPTPPGTYATEELAVVAQSRWNLTHLLPADDLEQAVECPPSVAVGGVRCDEWFVAGRRPRRPADRECGSIRNVVAPSQRRRGTWPVERIQPRAVLMENVPDMALADDMAVLRHMLARFEELGYEADARIVDTWLHGVPQHRQRLAIVGVRDGKAFSWPDKGNPVTLTTIHRDASFHPFKYVECRANPVEESKPGLLPRARCVPPGGVARTREG